MLIIEYEEKYKNEATKLLVELQEYLTNIDNESVQILTTEYSEHYLDYIIEIVSNNNGKIFLAIENGNAIGIIVGIIEPKDNEDKLYTRCPIRGVILELIVNKNSRKNGIGKELVSIMEKYFAEMNCEFVSLSVFVPNSLAVSFYKKMRYKPRNIEMIKRINDSKYKYRAATMQDLEYLWNKNIAEHENQAQWTAWKKQFLDDNKNGNALTFAIFDNNVPIGEGTLLFSPDCNAIKGRKVLADNSKTANINALRIQKEYEGRGLISKLVKKWNDMPWIMAIHILQSALKHPKHVTLQYIYIGALQNL